jgi:hypothetical protein
MMVLFGLSWPMSIYKSGNRHKQGKENYFIVLVWIGYACGITGKIASGHITMWSSSMCLILYGRYRLRALLPQCKTRQAGG